MSRIATVEVFEFDELSDTAKQKALDNYRYSGEYFWTRENEESFKQFGEWIGGSVDWSIGAFSHSRASCKLDWYYIDYPALEWLQDNLPEKECPFTGYYMDEMILKPMRDFMDNHDEDTDLQDLANECADAFCDAYQQDLEYQYSDEYIIEMFEANEWEFTKDGDMW